MISFLRPAKPSSKVNESEVNPLYRKNRRKVFFGIFIGYAGYYLVRKNFALIMPHLIKEGFNTKELGIILSGVDISYGVSKFLMGNVSDRSNPRFFLPLGLSLSALVMTVMGVFPIATSGVAIMFSLMFINGWFQGMGWPPCGKIMVNWFSLKERGGKMAVWNIAHNVGGGLIGVFATWGLILFNDDWKSALYLPAIFAFGIAVACIFLIKESPKSEGLPSIEEYKNDYPDKNLEINHTSARDIFVEHIFKNKLLWTIAIANAFIYLIRYGILNWAPTYLSEVKNYSIGDTGWAFFIYEYAGIPGTLLCGYLSDKVFKGRRGPVSIIYLSLVFVAIMVYWITPAGHHVIDNIALFSIGFLIYGPVMLIGVHALDLVPKNAAGTAAGFTGLFGYVGGALSASVLFGYIVNKYGWDGGFYLLLFAAIAAIFLLILVTKWEKKTN